MREIRIDGDGGAVVLNVVRYERSYAENASDANWLICEVSIDVHPFVGRYEASFTTYDFLDFGKALSTLSERLEGDASFEADEGALRLQLSMQSRGGLLIEGEAVVATVGRPALRFTIQADQSYLKGLCSAVNAVLGEFPVITGLP